MTAFPDASKLSPARSHEPISAARWRYRDAIAHANHVGLALIDAGREDRAAEMATAIDLGTRAAFLFSVSDADYDRATKITSLAIDHAQREHDRNLADG